MSTKQSTTSPIVRNSMQSRINGIVYRSLEYERICGRIMERRRNWIIFIEFSSSASDNVQWLRVYTFHVVVIFQHSHGVLDLRADRALHTHYRTRLSLLCIQTAANAVIDFRMEDFLLRLGHRQEKMFKESQSKQNREFLLSSERIESCWGVFIC